MRTLPTLPYAPNALVPFLSAEAMEFHYGKHHRKYVDQLNKLERGTTFAEMSLDDVVMKASGDLYDNAHLKLDELIRAVGTARTRLVDLEDMSGEELEGLRKEFERLHAREEAKARS